MFQWIKDMIVPYRTNITLEEVGGIPDHKEYFGNLRYSTTNAKLIAYRIKNKLYDKDGLRHGLGIYFEGLYKTFNGRYFIYYYEDEKNRSYRLMSINPTSLDKVCYMLFDNNYIKLRELEEIDYQEA